MKKLNPKQKKIAAGVAVGAILALFVLISRRGSSQVQDATTNPATGTGLPADYGAAAGGTFADNGASAGQLTTAVSDLADSFGERMDQQTSAFTGALQAQADAQKSANDQWQAQFDTFRQSLTATQSAPGPAGATGTPQQTQNAAPAATAKTAGLTAQQTLDKLKAGGAAPKNEFIQDSGTRKGQAYTVIQKNGHSYRKYSGGDTVLIK